jgi:hypothetical protein
MHLPMCEEYDKEGTRRYPPCLTGPKVSQALYGCLEGSKAADSPHTADFASMAGMIFPP